MDVRDRDSNYNKIADFLKTNKQKLKIFFPSKFMIPKVRYQIPFLKRNSEESASSQKTSSAQKVNNYKGGAKLEFSHSLLACSCYAEDSWKTL